MSLSLCFFLQTTSNGERVWTGGVAVSAARTDLTLMHYSSETSAVVQNVLNLRAMCCVVVHVCVSNRFNTAKMIALRAMNIFMKFTRCGKLLLTELGNCEDRLMPVYWKVFHFKTGSRTKSGKTTIQTQENLSLNKYDSFFWPFYMANCKMVSLCYCIVIIKGNFRGEITRITLREIKSDTLRIQRQRPSKIGLYYISMDVQNKQWVGGQVQSDVSNCSQHSSWTPPLLSDHHKITPGCRMLQISEDERVGMRTGASGKSHVEFIWEMKFKSPRQE